MNKHKHYYLAEFSIKQLEFPHLYKILNTERRPPCVIIEKHARLLRCIKVGQILKVKYYTDDRKAPPEKQLTAIQAILDITRGRFKGYCLVCLKILDRDERARNKVA
jgi:hypothetical protein